MKLVKKAIFTSVLVALISLSYQCAGFKPNSTTKESVSFKVKPVSYQDWYAGGDEGGTGINLYVPIVDIQDDVIIDSIYFRSHKGQLVRNYSRYTAVLKYNSPGYSIDSSDKNKDYPYDLAEDECAIKYIDKGEIKYHKVSGLTKKDRIYYQDGPPLAYQRRREAMIVSGVDDIKSEPIFQHPTGFKIKTIAFQEWYAGIKVGGTGLNVFIPIVNKEDHIKIDSVYFRNLKGKLVQNYGRYTAVLKNKSPYYTFKKPEKDEDFPFDLADNECAISFVENGEVKYVKVTNLSEKAGTYYENGPPSIYEKPVSTIVASTE